MQSLDGALEEVKKLSVDVGHTLILNGRHFAYVVEGAGPQTHFKLVAKRGAHSKNRRIVAFKSLSCTVKPEIIHTPWQILT